MKNSIPKGFLPRYRNGKSDETVYLPLSTGFLRLEYYEDGERFPLLRVAFVADDSEHSRPIGRLLELGIGAKPGPDDTATFISEDGVSGLQWSGGSAQWGHTYDDDSAPSSGRAVGLDDWIDECIETMINPPGSGLKKTRDRYNIANAVKKISRSEDGRDRFWRKAAPATDEDTALVLDVLKKAAKTGNGDLIFTLCDPLKRAKAGRRKILETVTGLIEGRSFIRDFDRSELQEVIEAHAAEATAELVDRWISICKKALKKKGVESSLQALHEGELYSSIAKGKNISKNAVPFAEEVVALVASSGGKVRDNVSGLRFYSSIAKLVKR